MNYCLFAISCSINIFLLPLPVSSTPEITNTAKDLSIEDSPVLQRWQRQIPNVLEEIKNDPSFRTRLRLGYAYFPSQEQAGGVNIGFEDILHRAQSDDSQWSVSQGF